jgi:hypothetical protein
LFAEPKRLLRIVSAAVNFIRFRMSQEDGFYSKKDELVKDFILDFILTNLHCRFTLLYEKIV